MAKTLSNNSASINNNTKEVVTMESRINEMVTAVESFTKTSDEGYVKNADIVALLSENSVTVGKKARRADLIAALKALVPEEETVVVEVGDLSITHDTMVVEAQDQKTVEVKDLLTNDETRKYILGQIITKSFTRNEKSQDKTLVGYKTIQQDKLFGVIKDGFNRQNRTTGNVPKELVQKVINELYTHRCIWFKRYESGAMVFGPCYKTLTDMEKAYNGQQ